MKRYRIIALAPLLSVAPAFLLTSPAIAQSRPHPVPDKDDAVVDRDDDDDDDDDDVRPSTAPPNIIVTAHKLDAARAKIEPDLGASVYSLDNDVVEGRPAGETTSLAQILLQAPGVAQTGGRQISVRGSQGIQYRINNVILPDGVTDLGEGLSPRLADRIDLLTGALPAQYGLQVGGVVNITTKSGTYGSGGQVELYGGSHGQVQPAFEYAGASGATSYFASGSYTRDDVGLPSPDGSRVPAHDMGTQAEGLAFADHVIDANSRVSLLVGTSDERFQIPESPVAARPGFAADLAANPVNGGRAASDSHYGMLSYLRSDGPATLQVSAFGRYSTIALRPGASAGLMTTGIGGDRHARDWTAGVQAEGAYTLGDAHTVRAGVVYSGAHLRNDLDLSVMPLVGDVPERIAATSRADRATLSLFLQDEWTPLAGLTLNMGGRLDHLSGDEGGTRFEPRLNAVWAGPAGITAHAGYARYLVAPTLFPSDQLTALAGTSAAPNGVGDVRSRFETDDYFDMGVERKSDTLTVGIDLFQRNVRDLLGSTDIGSPLIVRSFTYRRAAIRGVALTATYAQGPFSAWANFTYLDARARGISSGESYLPAALIAAVERRDVQPENLEPYAASTGASYKIDALRLTGTLLYGAGGRESRTDGAGVPARIPSYAQVDLAVTYHLRGLGGRPLDARIDLINAFDARYRLSDYSSMGIPQWGPRQGVFVGVEQAF